MIVMYRQSRHIVSYPSYQYAYKFPGLLDFDLECQNIFQPNSLKNLVGVRNLLQFTTVYCFLAGDV